ncbi:MAG: sigma 54-interacting transcriptional regulator [Deltaproteobacteria bacterium]|nr:sigma 54-interacting transcriptional regulator [Deltaproteobacteria bacterium]
MPTLIAKLEGGERRFELVKSVTSIGRDPQNDVRIEGFRLEPRHAHLLRDKAGYRLFATAGAKVLVNGKRRDEHVLSDGDVLVLGDLELVFNAGRGAVRSSEPPAERADPAEQIRLDAFKRLHTFTLKLSESPNFEALKRNLVDAVIELAGADSGFLILSHQSGTTAIDVARDRQGNDLSKEGARVSDSIVAQVVTRRRPILISDALEDTLFSDSRSVINFRIRSVIAVPIIRGDTVLGVLYLGSDRLQSFSQDYFDVLMVFAAHAGLLLENALLIASLREDNQALQAELSSRTFGEIVGGCPSMQEVFRTVSRLAPADISVMILGETGTGKELIARELHRRSSRASGPFVPINVSAIPENLLEAELFGFVRGAFTGAISDRKGKFLAAHGGTLFLDEIGDMPLGLQAKILRVLQDRVVERIGSNQTQPIDIRVVSATNRDLDAMQAAGSFRSDLFFRLNEAQILLPPLSERDDDIVLLATYFLARYNEKLGRKIRRFSPRAIAGMKRYRWPGNVRELEAKVKKAVVMAEGADIELADLGIEEQAMKEILALKDAKERFALQYIKEVLELNQGNRSKTARDLDIDPRTVFKYLEGK